MIEVKGWSMSLSRREFVQAAGAGLLLRAQILKAQSTLGSGAATGQISTGRASASRAKVALVEGGDRRKNITAALESIDDQIRAGLARKKYVVIKPNNVSDDNQLASTHADALRGILDYLEPRFRGPVVIAEAAPGDTLEGFENFKYPQLAAERRAQQVSLVDLNREGKYQTGTLVDYDLHIVPVRLAARLLDPDAYVISSAMLKTHNTVVATLSVKNMVLGSPLHSAPGDDRWNDKRKFHVGVRQTHLNMVMTAQKLRPNWGLAVIDGFEGMEGNGPGSGTAVPSHLAIASTDFIAADRVGIEAMGINSAWVGYLSYCGQAGLGQFDLSKIEIAGASLASVGKRYKLHEDIEKELQWMGPMTELPERVGSVAQRHAFDLG
jgi:uncharacterized protein (DUF362 family)